MAVGLLQSHTNTVIGNGKSLGILIGLNGDLKIRIILYKLRLGKCQKVQFIDGIGGIGDDLTQEDLTIGIK